MDTLTRHILTVLEATCSELTAAEIKHRIEMRVPVRQIISRLNDLKKQGKVVFGSSMYLWRIKGEV